MASTRAKGVPIVYTLHVGNLYGTERMALALLDGMGDRPRHVFAPPADRGASLVGEARARGWSAREVGGLGGLVRALLPLFLRHRTLEVVSTSVRHNLICAVLGRLLFVRVRQLNVVHGGGEDRHSYANKRRLNGTATRLVAVSGFVAGRLRKHGVDGRRILVIENFLAAGDLLGRPVRPPFAATPGRAARPLDPGRVRIAVVSRLDPVKRIDVLLDALHASGMASLVVDVYGGGPDLDAARATAREQALPVRFHGFVADVERRLPEADLLVHLCPDEPFGLAVLEAFAAGVPVLVPASGGTGEIVRDGVDGFTCPPGNPEALAARLRDIFELAPARLDAIVATARDTLAVRFGQAGGVRAYREALAESPRGRVNVRRDRGAAEHGSRSARPR